MKKQFSRRLSYGADRSRSRTIWWYGLAVVVVILLILARIFTPNFFAALAAPVWKAGSSLDTTVSGFFAGFENKAKLSNQNTTLEEQVQTLTNENEVLTARSQDLTKLLGGSSASSGDQLLAGVLARPPVSPYDTLVLSAGKADGVVSGALVYTAGGIPIGTIAGVNQNTSQVSLFSTSGRTTSGWIGANRVPVTLTGQGTDAFTATIPETATVAVGDTVYVPGPGALPIGTVVKVGTDPSSPTEVIYIQPLVNLFSITWVEIAHS